MKNKEMDLGDVLTGYLCTGDINHWEIRSHPCKRVQQKTTRCENCKGERKLKVGILKVQNYFVRHKKKRSLWGVQL